jgi:hypothetical protein
MTNHQGNKIHPQEGCSGKINAEEYDRQKSFENRKVD